MRRRGTPLQPRNQVGTPVDEGRARDWPATIRDGAAAGSGVLALIASLTHLLGL